jgi:2,4-dienoyl-CoA reductase-like NADH-dependent reductase (Old Yellow Enzyme family)
MASPELAEKEGFEIVGLGAIPVTDGTHVTPREMTETEILFSIDDFAQVTKNATDAGFGGIELRASYDKLL